MSRVRPWMIWSVGITAFLGGLGSYGARLGPAVKRRYEVIREAECRAAWRYRIPGQYRTSEGAMQAQAFTEAVEQVGDIRYYLAPGVLVAILGGLWSLRPVWDALRELNKPLESVVTESNLDATLGKRSPPLSVDSSAAHDVKRETAMLDCSAECEQDKPPYVEAPDAAGERRCSLASCAEGCAETYQTERRDASLPRSS